MNSVSTSMDHTLAGRMGSEPDYEPNSTPKLPIFSRQTSEPPWMLTPPLHTSASVPFNWEEAPGKPRLTTAAATQSKPKSARCLDLPPRLLTDFKFTNTPSPTTVLDGPDVGRSLSFTLSIRKGESRSWRRGGLKEKEIVGNGSEFSSSVVDASSEEGGTKVKITRIKRRGSFLNVSHAKSHLLASIYESLKQAIPWRRREEKFTKKGGPHLKQP